MTQRFIPLTAAALALVLGLSGTAQAFGGIEFPTVKFPDEQSDSRAKGSVNVID